MSKKTLSGILFSVVAIVVAFVIACGVGSSWFTNLDIKTWFNGWGKGISDNSGDNDGEQNGGDGSLVVTPELTCKFLSLEVVPYSDEGAFIISEPENEDGVATYSSSNGICTINATVISETGGSPEQLQYVSWELSDYNAGVELITDGTSATVKTVNGFTKQLTLTCRSVLDETKFTTVNLDYARSISNIKMKMQYKEYSYSDFGSSARKSITIDIPYFTTSRYMEGSPLFESQSITCLYGYEFGSNGTIDDEIETFSMHLEYSDEFKGVIGSKIAVSTFKVVGTTYPRTVLHYVMTGGFKLKDLLGNGGDYSLMALKDDAEYGSYISSFNNLRDDAIRVSLEFKTKYRGVQVFNYGITLNVNMGISSVQTDTSSVVL